MAPQGHCLTGVSSTSVERTLFLQDMEVYQEHKTVFRLSGKSSATSGNIESSLDMEVQHHQKLFFLHQFGTTGVSEN